MIFNLICVCLAVKTLTMTASAIAIKCNQIALFKRNCTIKTSCSFLSCNHVKLALYCSWKSSDQSEREVLTAALFEALRCQRLLKKFMWNIFYSRTETHHISLTGGVRGFIDLWEKNKPKKPRPFQIVTSLGIPSKEICFHTWNICCPWQRYAVQALLITIPCKTF